MASTPQLAQLAALADHHQWRIVLVGDPRQFSAVGRGGMFGLLAETHGAVELDHIHRFTHPWERDASLRLRAGDVSVLDLYAAAPPDPRRRPREPPNGGRSAAGRPPAATANRSPCWRRRTRPSSGSTTSPNTPASPPANSATATLAAGPYRLRVGDEIATRRNDRQLHTDRGLMVKNRDTWTIDQIHRGGALTVTGRTGTVRLPAAYVREHVELAYAQTSHAAQGRTVDRSLLVLDAPTDVRGVYVPMTRGRSSNEVFVVTDGTRTARDVLADALTQDWIDTPATVRRAELAAAAAHPPRTGPGPVPAARRSASSSRPNTSSARAIERHDLARADDPPRRLAQLEPTHQRLAAEHAADHRRLAAAQAVLDRHDRPFHRWGHAAEIADARRTVTGLEHAIPDQQRRLDELARRDRPAPHPGPRPRPATTRPGPLDHRTRPDPHRHRRRPRRPPPPRPPLPDRRARARTPPPRPPPRRPLGRRRRPPRPTPRRLPPTTTRPASTGTTASTTAPTPPAATAPTTPSNNSTRPLHPEHAPPPRTRTRPRDLAVGAPATGTGS